MTSAPTIGLIGVGLLGRALAQRLIAGGFEVVGRDVDPDAQARLTDLGARAAPSVADLAASCGPILLAVLDTAQVENVMERELLPALGKGSGRIVLCASTCDPDRIASLGERLAAGGLHLLETPVSGTSGQVARGEAVGLVGGDAAHVKAVEPILHALFLRWFNMGGLGAAGRAKLAINLILGLNRLALAEGLVLAERLGLDGASFLEVARQSAAYSQAMDVKGLKMVRREYAAEGRVRQHLKDVELMLAQAARAGQQLPLLAVHADVLAACLRAGEGEADNSIVVEEIRRRRA